MIQSPIVRSFSLFAGFFVIAFAVLPGRFVNDALDCFSMVAALVVLATHGPAFMEVLREKRPDRADLMVAGIVMVAFGYGTIRALRAVAIELGVIHSPVTQYIFGAATVFMVFGAFLNMASTGRINGTIRPSAWFAMGAALVGGLIMSAAVLTLRWWL